MRLPLYMLVPVFLASHAKALPLADIKCTLQNPIAGVSEVWLGTTLAQSHRGIFTTLEAQEELGFERIQGIGRKEPMFLLSSRRRFLLNDCVEAVRRLKPNASMAHLKSITAKREHDPADLPVVFYNEKLEIAFALNDRSQEVAFLLKDYNFAAVLPGYIYRSQKLGYKGLEALSQALKIHGQLPAKTVASIHVMGFGDKKGGSYNLEELRYCEERQMLFMHSYHNNPKHWVYLDGTNPSRIDPEDKDHGDVFREYAVKKFIPDSKIREMLRIDLSREQGLYRDGNIDDFLSTLENLIDAPWPLVFHCKGGRHKTGMIAIIFETLLREQGKTENWHTVNVPIFKNRIDRFFNNKDGFFKMLGGPMYEEYFLKDEEVSYFRHNESVFRWENIEFVRNFLDCKFFNEEQLVTWQKIKGKFANKVENLSRVKRPLAGEKRVEHLALSTTTGDF